jgi:hypothetical protein
MPIVEKHCHMLSTSFEKLKNPRFQAQGFFSSRGGYIRPHATMTHIVTLLTAVNEMSAATLERGGVTGSAALKSSRLLLRGRI